MAALQEVNVNVDQPFARKTAKSVSNEIRQLIISRLNSGMTIKEVVIAFDVDYKYVSKLHCNYRKTGQVFKRSKGHRKPLLTDQMKNYLYHLVDEDCTQRLIDMKIKLLETFPTIQSICLQTIASALNDFHYSFKRVTYVPQRRNDQDVIEQRYHYAMNYNRLIPDKNKIFFIDEFGCQISSRAKYGRSMKGTKCHKVVPQIRSRNYSVCAAMSESSLYFFEIQDKPYNSDHFVGFLTQLFQHLAEDGITGAHLVMDNVRFHHNAGVENLIRAHSHNLVFLPSYSPFMNPIEELFHQWKSSIRRKEPINEDQLYEAVHNSSEDVIVNNCQNYVRHMESYLFMCLNREVIES